MKKRILLSLFIISLFVFGFGMMNVSADSVLSGECGENLTWNLDDSGTLTISGNGSMENYTYPSKAPWYSYQDSIKTVFINSGVTSIGDMTFSGCEGLISVTIPDSVTNVGESAFYACFALNEVRLSNNLTSIPSYMFSNCHNLTNISIPDGVTEIGYSAFSGCYSLTSVIIPDTVINIAEWAFDSCENLTDVYYTGTLQEWQEISIDELFNETLLLAKKHFNYDVVTGIEKCGDNLTWNLDDSGMLTISGNGEMNDWSDRYLPPWYDDRWDITSLVIEDGVTKIGSYSFYECDMLSNVRIPDGVTEIGSYAFGGCISIGSITIPDSVTNIGKGAFSFCLSLNKVSLSDNLTSIPSNMFSDCGGLTSITIPDGVTEIGYSAFSCCGLSEVKIPDSVYSIGSGAFGGCYGLTSITLPNSVISIGYDPFFETNYTNDDSNWENGVLYIGKHLIKAKENISGEYVIKSGTLTIADGAFELCENLTGITIPQSVKRIGNSAFSACFALKNVYISDVSAWCVMDFPDNAANPLWYADNLYLNNELVTELIIPDGTGKIGDGTFYNCKSIQSVVIPKDVISIGNEGFGHCSNLRTVTISDGMESIGIGAFRYCSNLTDIIIPDSVRNIGSQAFYACRNLKDIVLPNSVTSIENNTFFYCDSLTEIVIPEGVTTIGSYAFEDCFSLTSMTIPNSITSMGEGMVKSTGLTDIYYMGTRQQWSELSKGIYGEMYFEEELPTIHYVANIKTMLSKDKKTLIVNLINIENGKSIILALYNGNMLSEIQTEIYKGEDIPFVTTMPYTDACVMVWDDFGSLEPVCLSEKVK